MQNLPDSDFRKRIETDIYWCFLFEEAKKVKCKGASGRKLRCVCVWCPNYEKGDGNDNEKGN